MLKTSEEEESYYCYDEIKVIVCDANLIENSKQQSRFSDSNVTTYIVSFS